MPVCVPACVYMYVYDHVYKCVYYFTFTKFHVLQRVVNSATVSLSKQYPAKMCCLDPNLIVYEQAGPNSHRTT